MRRYLPLLVAALALHGEPGPTRPSAPLILSFTLGETEAALARQLGPPEHASAGNVYRTLDYNFSDRADEDFDWTFYFSQPGGTLLSVTRNFAKPSSVADLLTGPDVHQHVFHSGTSTMPALSRSLTGDRVLVAIGIAKPDQPCSQLVLIRKSALATFYPWIARDPSAK